LWQEWDHIVAEAAQEDGTYIVRERLGRSPILTARRLCVTQAGCQQIAADAPDRFETSLFRTLASSMRFLEADAGHQGGPA